MEKELEMPRKLLRVVEVASWLDVSRSCVYALMDRGDLPYVKIGKCRRVRSEDVTELLERGSVGRKT